MSGITLTLLKEFKCAQYQHPAPLSPSLWSELYDHSFD